MTKKKSIETTVMSAAEAAAEAAALLAEHNKWERESHERVEYRLSVVEKAIVQINHFTESIEKLDLNTWQTKVNTDMSWIKTLMGATAIAAIGQLVVSLIKGG